MNILITICARGGSKGIPGKNIKPLNGKPLLHYTLEHALEFINLHNGKIQLSTDDASILNCAKELGYHTQYVRPKVMATDRAGKLDAIRDAWKYAEEINKCSFDFVLDMDVTSPLRTIADLNSALEKLVNHSSALNIFSVNPAARNPYFNMVEELENGFVKLVKDGGLIKSRQLAPKVYDMNASFYIFKREFMTSDLPTVITDHSIVYEMPHLCFDLDHSIDFTIMELLLQQNVLDFKI
ncbi:acylneuraminate cytidylyltransferase family protein [Marivirga sp. S37H4]|uniref:Acylneuraminate cytidylyltransferase family protein n=1 Tax=Marivirga aurantiaca TaxID=2802615 RepID=A0A934WWR7_9BACT|nr:acylneuraminate cytidylyltransferase family protein [Marivirga aurantiaca]MBK6264518.1 acylneuraminate cytidylyltransferase family protein [Marivirga aurantiaca]